MNASKTTKVTDETTAAEEWLDQIEPAEVPGRDGKNLRHVAEAAERAGLADSELRAAVANARAAGETWAMIGMVLGVTRQAAFQRFGRDMTGVGLGAVLSAEESPRPLRARGSGGSLPEVGERRESLVGYGGDHHEQDQQGDSPQDKVGVEADLPSDGVVTSRLEV